MPETLSAVYYNALSAESRKASRKWSSHHPRWFLLKTPFGGGSCTSPGNHVLTVLPWRMPQANRCLINTLTARASLLNKPSWPTCNAGVRLSWNSPSPDAMGIEQKPRTKTSVYATPLATRYLYAHSNTTLLTRTSSKKMLHASTRSFVRPPK